MASQIEKSGTVADARATLTAAQTALAHAQALAVSDPAPDPTPLPTGTLHPKFGQLVAGGWVDLGPFVPAPMAGEDPFFSTQMTAYSGITYDAARNCVYIFGGGHDASNNPALMKFPLDTLAWVAEHAPLPLSAMTFDNYDFTLGAWKTGPSGSYPWPAARHTEGETVLAGDELILMSMVEGNRVGLPGGDWSAAPSFAAGADYYTKTSGRIAHYNLKTQACTFSPVAGVHNWPACCLDPLSGKIVEVGQDAFALYDPVAKTRTVVFDFARGVNPAKNEDGTQVADNWQNINQSLVYAPKKDRLYYLGNLGVVFEINLDRVTPANSTITKLTTTGTPPPGSAPEVNGAAYDSVNALIGVGPWQGTFYAFDPETKKWASKDLGIAISCAYHCLDYVEPANAYVCITTGNETVALRWE